jgi:hypothetical protein
MTLRRPNVSPAVKKRILQDAEKAGYSRGSYIRYLEKVLMWFIDNYLVTRGQVDYVCSPKDAPSWPMRFSPDINQKIRVYAKRDGVPMTRLVYTALVTYTHAETEVAIG